MDNIVGEKQGGLAAKARQELESIIAKVNTSDFDIGELLHRIKKCGYRPPQFNTHQEYEASLPMKQQKLRYLRTIAEVCEAVGIPRSQYEPVGVSRLRAITSLDPYVDYTNPVTGEVTPMKEFIKGFIEAGTTLSVEEVQNNVRVLKGLVGEKAIVWRNLPFHQVDDDEVIKPALEKARKELGSVGKDDEGISKDASDSACVKIWAVEYLNTPELA